MNRPYFSAEAGAPDPLRITLSRQVRFEEVDYLRPLRFQDVFTIEGVLHWTAATRINMEFILRDGTQAVTTTGFTVQMMLDMNGDTLLVPPAFYRALIERWKDGALP